MKLKNMITLAAVMACLFWGVNTAYAGRGGGGRGGGGNGGGGNGNGGNGNGGNADGSAVDDGKMEWHDTIEEALDWSKKNKGKPVMLVIRRGASKHDLVLVKQMSNSQILAEASKDHFAAVKGAPRVEEIREIAKLAGAKSLPAIVWIDQYGNPVKTMAVTGDVNALADVVRNWPSLIAGLEKIMKDKITDGEKLAAQGHLHEAYMELSSLSDFKGPAAEAAQKAREKVKEKWTALAEMTMKQPVGSRQRMVILEGLLKETQGTDVQEEIQKLVADNEKKLLQPEAAAIADAKPLAPSQPEKASKPAQPVSADDSNDMLDTTGKGKALADLSAAPVAVDNSSSQVQIDVLNGSSDAHVKDAAKMIQEGMAAYRKATSDSMERGEARNNLLKAAYENLNKSSTILMESITAKPDPKIEKLVQQLSMMMYGCMKYQSL